MHLLGGFCCILEGVDGCLDAWLLVAAIFLLAIFVISSEETCYQTSKA